MDTLGSGNPMQLVHAMDYGVSKWSTFCCPLRSLTYGQIELDTDVNGNEVLQYRQTTANKSNQGGPKQKILNSKDVVAYPYNENPERYIVHLYKKNISQ